MTFRKLTAVFAISVLLAVLPPLSAGALEAPELPNPSQEFSIVGAGASFPYPLIDLWRVEYNKEFSNVDLNYQSIGSGGGITQHIEKTVNFAASDKPLGSEARLAPGTLHIPEAIGGVVIAYNLPEFQQSGLKLTGDVLADIFLAKITKWNDPRIAETNPGVNLPDEDIVTVQRSDGSGTTFVFTDYLTSVSPEFDEAVGKGKSVPWPSGLGGKGNEGVASHVRDTPYAIGYVELAYAFQTGLNYAFVENADGTAFIEPSLDSISAASAGVSTNLPDADGDWSGVTLVSAPGSDSYPIASFTYLLIYDDLAQVVDSKEKAKAIIHLINWMITDGQEFSPDLLYVPLSDPVVKVGQAGLSMVTYDGEILWERGTSEPEYQIPSWIRDSANAWGQGLISDEAYIMALQWLADNGILKI